MEKELKKVIIVAIGLSIFVVMLFLSLPFNMIMLFRFVVPSESTASIPVIASAALAGMVFMTIFDTLRFALLRRFSVYLNKELGEKILLGMFRDRALQQKSDHSTAMGDLSKVRAFLNSPTSAAFLDALISPLQLLIVFFLSPIMGILATLCIMIILATKLVSKKQTQELLKNSNMRFGQVNAFAQECVYNAQAIKAMGMQPKLAKKWRHMQDLMVRDQTEASEKAGIHSAITKSMGWIMQVLLMGVGFSMILAGTMDSGFVIIAVIIAGRVIMPMQMVVNGWQQYQDAKDAFVRLKEFFAELKEKDKEETLDLPEPKGHLAAESLVYGHGGKPIIKGVSFELEPGLAMGIIGPSGAGKTTLARMLTGSVRPQNGILRLDGADMHQWDQDRLGMHVGYLPQEVELFAGTIAMNISRFQEIDIEEVKKAAARVGLDEIIEMLPDGYDTMLEERGANLPGGLRQRIGLARALFGQPRILILDEPDASLDQAGLKALQEMIAQVHKEGITLILVTHRPQLLVATDKLLMLKNGQVAMYGPSKQVLQKLLPAKGKKG